MALREDGVNPIQAIAGIGLLGFGGILLVRALTELVLALASRNWPRTFGVITTSKVTSHESEDGVVERPVVTYRFSAGGPEITGDQVCFGAKNVGWTGGWARRVVARYPVGATVSVHHDPEDPREAVLEPGVRPVLLANLLMSVVLVAFGAFALLA